MRLPRVLSPQTHRRVDLLALPSVIAAVVWMSRRNSQVAALMSMIAAGEAAALLTTEYSPGFLRGTLADGALPRVRHYRHPSAVRRTVRAALAVCLAAEASLAGDGAEVSLSAIERTEYVEHAEGRQDL
jgi:hypothetical protein